MSDSIFSPTSVATRLEAAGWKPEAAAEVGRLFLALGALEGRDARIVWPKGAKTVYRILGADPATIHLRYRSGSNEYVLGASEIYRMFEGAEIQATRKASR